jgi:hypothetical protein
MALITSFVLHRILNADKLARESYFVSIHMAMLQAQSDGDIRPLNAILEDYGPGLLEPFPDGLLYHSDGSSFTLAEPAPCRISLFRKDRLIATDREFPRWEVSHEYATKYGQKLFPPETQQ